MAYIPLIKTTKWIDLSEEHKKLREAIEQDTKSACVDGGRVQPIMLQGAFGIGKTNSLYYLFHYGWEVLQTPTFYISLDEIVKQIKEYAETQPNGKMQNSELSGFINDIISSQIESIKSTDWNVLTQLYFPEFNKSNLNGYLNDFQSIEIIGDTDDALYQGFSAPLSASVIRIAIESKHRPLLLVDEFESKFYELKKYIETSIKRSIQNQTGLTIGISPESSRISSYYAPNYKIEKKSQKSSLFGSPTEEYFVQYDDGEKGIVFLKQKTNQAYFKDNDSSWPTYIHYYESLDFCINGLHYFLKTGKILKEGFIETYS